MIIEPRNRKPTQKVLENQQSKHQVKKQKQKQTLQKRIEKQKSVIESKLNDEVKDDYVEVVRDDSSKIYKDLVYINDDVAKQTKKLIDGFRVGFLPELFKGLVPLYSAKKEPEIKIKVSFKDLEAGKYHTLKSKSDKSKASVIKTVRRHFPHFKDVGDDLTYIIKNHRLFLLDALDRTFKKKLSIPTLKNYINTLMRIMFISFKNPKTEGTYIKYATLSKALGQKQEAHDDANELNENEMTRYINFSLVLKEQKELKNKFNSYVNNQSKDAYDTNLDLLLVSLYSLIPPLRQEPLLLEFKSPELKNTNDKSKDYIYFERDEVILNLNLNKKKHEPIDFPITGELAELLKESYKLYPRKYLFTDARKYPNFNQKLSASTVANRLRRVFIKYGVNVGASILRASYISYLFNKNPHMSMTEIKAISNKMRSSHRYILTSYRKIIKPILEAVEVNTNNQPIIFKQESSEDIIDTRPQHITKLVDDPYKKNNEKLKDKYHKDDSYKKKVLDQQKEYRNSLSSQEKQKRKLISMLRASESYRKTVKQSTLDKYGIVIKDILK